MEFLSTYLDSNPNIKSNIVDLININSIMLPNIFNYYKNDIIDLIELVVLSEEDMVKYKQDMSRLANDLYGTPDLNKLLLYINDYKHNSDFTDYQIYILNDSNMNYVLSYIVTNYKNDSVDDQLKVEEDDDGLINVRDINNYREAMNKKYVVPEAFHQPDPTIELSDTYQVTQNTNGDYTVVDAKLELVNPQLNVQHTAKTNYTVYDSLMNPLKPEIVNEIVPNNGTSFVGTETIKIHFEVPRIGLYFVIMTLDDNTTEGIEHIQSINILDLSVYLNILNYNVFYSPITNKWTEVRATIHIHNPRIEHLNATYEVLDDNGDPLAIPVTGIITDEDKFIDLNVPDEGLYKLKVTYSVYDHVNEVDIHKETEIDLDVKEK